MIHFKIDGQRLSAEHPIIVADSQNYLHAEFKFSADWDGLWKIAYFRQGNTLIKKEIDESENVERTGFIYPADNLMLSAGRWEVSVYGTSDGVKITSSIVVIDVEKSGLGGGNPFNASVDDIESLMNELNSALNSIDERVPELIDDARISAAVNAWLDTKYADESWRLTDEEKSAIAQNVMTSLSSQISGYESSFADMESRVGGFSADLSEQEERIDAIETDLSGKQDTISDLDAIRSGATKASSMLKVIKNYREGITISGGAYSTIQWSYADAGFTSQPDVFFQLTTNGKGSGIRASYGTYLYIHAYDVWSQRCGIAIYNNASYSITIGLSMLAVGN